MNILMASAEAVPFAKVGGMADVVGSLPTALQELDVDARVIMPGYGLIDHQKYNISHLFNFEFSHRTGTSQVSVYTCVHNEIPFYFVQGWPYFGEEGEVYTTWDWDVPRFIFFNQMVMATAWELNERLGWMPDVIHAHDWHTGLLPFLLAENRNQFGWSEVASVMTIHNIAYQGNGVGGFLWDAGVGSRYHPELNYHDLNDNLLGIGCAYADKITTVSPRYATEIQYPYAGYELAGIMRDRADDLVGILNGLDVDLWNPEIDPKLISNYNAENFESQRPINKRHLQAYSNLPINDEVPLVGMVTRLATQKGLDLALPALRQVLVDTDMQFVLLGTGEPDIEFGVWRLCQDFHWKARAFLQFDAALAQHIYAGSDIFLMPSHFEPCGMGQMMAMRYGSLPLVRETGGLADTVANYDNGNADVGTGFVFSWEEADAVEGTLRWAVRTYQDKPEAWKRMQKRGMQTDFSWTKSANDYTGLYQQAIDKTKVRPSYES